MKIKHPVTVVALVCTLLYLIAAAFFPARMSIEIADGLAIAMTAGVAIAYGRRALRMFFANNPDIYEVIIIGIAGLGLTGFINLTWRLAARIRHQPDMLDSHVLGFTVTGIAFFSALHLLVKGPAKEGRIWRGASIEAWAAIFTALFVGLAIGITAISIDSGLFGWAWSDNTWPADVWR